MSLVRNPLSYAGWTPEALELRRLAAEAAVAREWPTINSGDFLLGCVRLDDDVAGRALRLLSITEERILRSPLYRSQSGRRDEWDFGLPEVDMIQPDETTTSYLSRASDVAEELGTDGIGPESVLLAVVRGEHSEAARILQRRCMALSGVEVMIRSNLQLKSLTQTRIADLR